MKKLFNILKIIVFGNLLIAIAAASQSLLTYSIFEIPVNYDVVILEWSATLLLYNFSLWLSMPVNSADSNFRRTKWFSNNKLVILLLSFVAVVSLVYALIHLHTYTFFLLFLIGLLSLGYAIPIVRFKGRLVSLRQVFGIKVFLIAIVWTLSVVGMPIVEFLSIETNSTIAWADVMYWMLVVVVFIIGITLPFDIRDLNQDRYYNVKTIPVLIGQQKAIFLCYFLIITHIVLILFAPDHLITHKMTLIIADFCVFFIFYAILFQKKASYESVYLLDLMLVIQFVLYYGAIFCNNFIR